MIAVVTADAIVRNRKASFEHVKGGAQMWELLTHYRKRGIYRKASVSSHEKFSDGTDKGQPGHTDSKAVEDEQRLASILGGLGDISNLFWPMEISQIYARYQLALDNLGGIEMKQGRWSRAASDILSTALRCVR